MRRECRSLSAVHYVLHLSWLRPLAQTWVHHTCTLMKKQALLRVTTTSLSGCSLWKLQTSCAMFLSYQCLSMFAASSTEWLEISPIQRPGRFDVLGVLRNLFVPYRSTRDSSVTLLCCNNGCKCGARMHRSSYTHLA